MIHLFASEILILRLPYFMRCIDIIKSITAYKFSAKKHATHNFESFNIDETDKFVFQINRLVYKKPVFPQLLQLKKIEINIKPHDRT